MSSLFVVIAENTADGNTLFGKNSDREPNEGQSIIRIPEMPQPDTMVECTFIQIPQVKKTNEVILSKPFHSWGAEMGINQHGVTIGNASVYTKYKPSKSDKGLTGGDMVRLALERTSNAELAMETICGLVSAFGQDVPNGYQLKEYAHNSFLIADPNQAFLLETAGKQWVAKKIKDFHAISNSYSISSEYDYYSKDVVNFAKSQDWIKKGKDFSFKDAYGNLSKIKSIKADKTYSYLTDFLTKRNNNFSLTDSFELLRSHYPSKKFNPSNAKKESVCKHITRSQNSLQTNSSFIAELKKEGLHTAWLTGTSNPCISIFKPFFMPGSNIFNGLVREPAKLINNSLWWQAELFNRLVSTNFNESLKTFDKEREELENSWIEKVKELQNSGAGADSLNEFSTNVFNKHIKKIMQWNYDLKKNPPASKQFSPLYNKMINQLNEEATPMA